MEKFKSHPIATKVDKSTARIAADSCLGTSFKDPAQAGLNAPFLNVLLPFQPSNGQPINNASRSLRKISTVILPVRSRGAAGHADEVSLKVCYNQYSKSEV